MNKEDKPTSNPLDLISRKEALKKIGRYTALTAAGTFLILQPLKAQSVSPPRPGGGGGFF